jgi:hypothetical protein
MKGLYSNTLVGLLSVVFLMGCGGSDSGGGASGEKVTISGTLPVVESSNSPSLAINRSFSRIGDITKIIAKDNIGDIISKDIVDDFSFDLTKGRNAVIGFYNDDFDLVAYLGKEDEKILLTTPDTPNSVELGELDGENESLNSLEDKNVLLNISQPQVNISKLYDDASIEKLLNVDINQNNILDKDENLSIVFTSNKYIENASPKPVYQNQDSFSIEVDEYAINSSQGTPFKFYLTGLDYLDTSSTSTDSVYSIPSVENLTTLNKDDFILSDEWEVYCSQGTRQYNAILGEWAESRVYCDLRNFDITYADAQIQNYYLEFSYMDIDFQVYNNTDFNKTIQGYVLPEFHFTYDENLEFKSIEYKLKRYDSASSSWVDISDDESKVISFGNMTIRTLGPNFSTISEEVIDGTCEYKFTTEPITKASGTVEIMGLARSCAGTYNTYNNSAEFFNQTRGIVPVINLNLSNYMEFEFEDNYGNYFTIMLEYALQ